MRFILLLAALFSALFTLSSAYAAGPQSFDKAKMLLRTHVYHDRTNDGDFYCGCDWQWNSRNNSGGKTELRSCGYEVRSPGNANRAGRIEWEHIMPAHSFGEQRQCWQEGGRKNCAQNDPVFERMEADMHNLTVAVGEVNGDRSNFRFTALPGTPSQYGQCPVKIDFKQRAAEPRDEVKGQVARTYFYMHDHYGLSMSRQQEQLFMAWDRQFPVSAWERERSRRIARHMGHENPFVTGDKKWQRGGAINNVNKDLSPRERRDHQEDDQNVGDAERSGSRDITMSKAVNGVVLYPRSDSAYVQQQQDEQEQPVQAQPVVIDVEQPILILPIYGNKNSQIYHLADCPSYESVAERNRVIFHHESHAIAAGYRKAGNCPK